MTYFRKRLPEYLPIVAVFCLALLVRVAYNFTVAVGYVPRFDAGIYNGLALRLLSTHCYCYAPHHPTVFRPPLWPFLIAAIYAIAGQHTLAVRLFCALLGSGTCVLTYLFARELFGRRISLLIGIIAAIYAGMFIWDGWLFSESLFIFLQTAFLLTLLRLQRGGQPGWAVLSGVLLGLSALARPNGALLLALLVLWTGVLLAFRLQPWRMILARVTVIALVAFAVTLPWTLRNYTVTHSLAPVSTIGTTLAGAYNNMVDQPNTGIYGLWWLPPADNGDIHPHTAADERALEQRALTWMLAHPDQVRILMGIHFQHMWVPYLYTYTDLPFEEFPQRPASQLVRQLIPAMSIPVFLLAGLGLAVTWRRHGPELLAVYLLIALTIVENVAFYGSPRFRAPIEPFLVLLAGGAVWWFAGLVRRLLPRDARGADHRPPSHRDYHTATGPEPTNAPARR